MEQDSCVGSIVLHMEEKEGLSYQIAKHDANFADLCLAVHNNTGLKLDFLLAK